MPIKRIVVVLLLFFSAIVAAIAAEDNQTVRAGSELPPLPEPVTNNALASLKVDGREFLVSFAGLGAGKTWRDTHAKTFVLDSESDRWRNAGTVPGGVGRLAAIAVGIRDRIYVFGGYTVAEDGEEASTPWVHAFDPLTGTFEERQAMPVPVEDTVAVSYQDRYIYLVSGWHDLGNVNLVQRYDIDEDSWVQATPTPGPAVFGHAGGIVGNTIVYCDGVAITANTDRARDFAATNECYAGLIDHEDARRIDWRKIRSHPGPARYRMAAAGIPYIQSVVFIGGSDNPYNYNGMGYNQVPSSPVPGALSYDLDTGRWRTLAVAATATMDHRGLAKFRDQWITAGGMLQRQFVTDRVFGYRIE
ncbi:MAG: galactose oxidase [Woeseiaceae bacterium]|nr:galactose oxidase [Woeseiaceae bacterium]